MNISLIFNVVLLVAVIVLFVLVCRLNKIHSVDGEMYGLTYAERSTSCSIRKR